jgi:WXG100 family type VII secretion target
MQEQLYGQTEKALSRAADLVDTARVDVKVRCNQLSGHVAQLMAGWGGQGATSFNHLMATWQEKQETVLRALDNLSLALVETERDNVATDDDQVVRNSNLASRLG